MFNPFEAAGTILSDLWPEMAIFSSFLVTGGPFLGNLMGTRLNISELNLFDEIYLKKLHSETLS